MNKIILPQYHSLIEKINTLKSARSKPILIALDGRSGVGKSTLAKSIAQDVSGVIVSGDDFFLGGSDSEWDTRRTEAKVADCIDWKRLRKEALEPLLAGNLAHWHPFDFASGVGLSKRVIQCDPASVIILDGAYS